MTVIRIVGGTASRHVCAGRLADGCVGWEGTGEVVAVHVAQRKLLELVHGFRDGARELVVVNLDAGYSADLIAIDTVPMVAD